MTVVYTILLIIKLRLYLDFSLTNRLHVNIQYITIMFRICCYCTSALSLSDMFSSFLGNIRLRLKMTYVRMWYGSLK